MAQLIVGLDIGTSAVRAAELDVGPARPVLLTYGQVGLPPGAIVDGEIHDGVAVTDAISRLWKNGQFSSTSVVVGIAGLRAITREIDLPFVPDDEIDSAVRFQSEEVIPFPPDQTILSSQILADYTSPEGDKMRRVLVAAAHRDLVDGVITAVEGANLTVTGVDLVSSALVRAISGQGATDQPEAIVSVGAGLTVVVIHQQGRPQFVRTIGSGGNATTAVISASLDLPLSDAEAIKRRFGEPTPQVQAAERSAQSSINDLVGEVRNSIQYFASLPGRLPISRVLITGGGSYLHGLIPMLEAQVRMPVQPVSPLEHLDTSKIQLTAEQAAQVSAVLSTPIGLALPESNPAVKKFNLLPPEVVKRAKMKRLERQMMIGAVIIIVALVLFGGWKFYQVHAAQSDITSLNTQIASANAEIPKYSKVVAAQHAFTQGTARRTSVLNAAVDWPTVLSGLISLTPSAADLTAVNGGKTVSNGLEVETFAGTTTATATSSGTETAAAIGSISSNVQGPGPVLISPKGWTNAIAGSNLFANPVITSVTQNPNGSVIFPTTISVTPAASLAKNASLQ